METFNRAYSIKIFSLQRKQEHKTGGIVWGADRWAGDHSVDYECHLSLRIRCSDDTAIGHTAISSKLDSRLTPTPPPTPTPITVAMDIMCLRRQTLHTCHLYSCHRGSFSPLSSLFFPRALSFSRPLGSQYFGRDTLTADTSIEPHIWYPP